MKATQNPAWRIGWIILALAACVGSALASGLEESLPGSGGQASALRWQSDADSIALLKDGKPVWKFNYASGLSKPYFHPVSLPGGSDLTWLSPPDHRWHLALFFSWKYLNKINYWEETAGVANGATQWSNVKIDSRPDFSAIVSMDLRYHPQSAAHDVLTEKRTMRISPPAPDGSYFMDWRQEFTAGNEDVVMDRTPPDTKPDGNARGGYAGLSIRLAKELTNPRITATADIGAFQRNRYGFAANAAEFSGEIDGGEVGVAFLDHSTNPRLPSRWYGIVDGSAPFWFLNASWLQLEPYTLPAHQKLVLRYRVLVHPQRWDAARLEKERARYLQEAGKD
jgi:hypothetical protein